MDGSPPPGYTEDNKLLPSHYDGADPTKKKQIPGCVNVPLSNNRLTDKKQSRKYHRKGRHSGEHTASAYTYKMEHPGTAFRKQGSGVH